MGANNQGCMRLGGDTTQEQPTQEHGNTMKKGGKNHNYKRREKVGSGKKVGGEKRQKRN